MQVITDGATGRSKGYGFVRFTSEAERDRALKEMNGVFVGSRPIRVSLATARRPGEAPRGAPPGPPGGGYGHSHGQGHGQGHNQDYGGFGGPGPGPREPPGGGAAGESDHNNTTLFLGNLSPYVTEDELKSAFARFGDIVYTKIPPGKNCGFVQFTERRVAEYAMQEMQGQFVGSAPVRISWGKSSGRGAGGREGGREGGRDGGRDGGAYASAPGYGGYGGYGYDVAGYNSYAAYDPYGMAYSGYSDPYAVSVSKGEAPVLFRLK